MERAIAFSIVDKKITPSSAFSLSFLSLCCQTPALHILSKSGLALISAPVIHSSQARRWFSPVSRSGKCLKNPLKSAAGSAIIRFLTAKTRKEPQNACK